MKFENDILLLRAVEPEDLDLLYKWENDVLLWEAGNTRNPYSKFALKQYISNSIHDIYDSNQLRLMIVEKSSGEVVGTVDLFDFEIHHSRIALGLFVDPKFQGRGYASNALYLAESYVFKYLKVHQLYCHIASRNTASISMFEKENFVKTAVLKDWVNTTEGFDDIIVFQQLKRDYIKRINQGKLPES